MNRQGYGYPPPPPRRRGGLGLLGWGCLALILGMVAATIIGAVIILPRLPEIAARFAGFEPEGNTAAVFVNPAPAPVIQLQNPAEPPVVAVDAGQYGNFTIDTSQIDLEVGQDTQTGQQTAVATFTEPQLLTLCRERSALCANNDPRFRNASIDLKPGGAVINAEFYIPQVGTWQAAGIVMKLNTFNAQFEIAGVDINGQLFSVPESMASSVDEIARNGNALLRDVAVNAGGAELVLSEIYADETALTLVMR